MGADYTGRRESALKLFGTSPTYQETVNPRSYAVAAIAAATGSVLGRDGTMPEVWAFDG